VAESGVVGVVWVFMWWAHRHPCCLRLHLRIGGFDPPCSAWLIVSVCEGRASWRVWGSSVAG
jgi:hypothetical protein